MKDKLYIIKIGGNVINSAGTLSRFLTDFALIKEKKLLVHGGGKLLEELAAKLGVTQQVHEGRRVTSAETMRLATMVYAGFINKQVVAKLNALQVPAIGLSGADANCVSATKRPPVPVDYGYAGDVTYKHVNTAFINLLLEQRLTPVFCSVTHNGQGQLLNTNADTMAAELAKSLAHQYDVRLHFCFEKKGVLKDPENEASLIATISRREYELLVQQNVISNGMLPKMSNAFEALAHGVKHVAIGHSDQLLNAIHQQPHAGTYLVA